MKKICFVLALLFQTAFAYPPLPEARSETEALFVRRIIDFWRDKEYPFAKNQIRAYLDEYKDTPFADHFYAMLGDMAMHEKAYQEALNYYNRITDEALTAHTQSKRWQTLYHLQQYTQLYQELSPIAIHENEEGRFYLAEAAFRQALPLIRIEDGKEQAKALCQEALPLYDSLTFSEVFGAHARLAIAEIYRFLDQPEAAAKIYLEIAENQEDNDEILFHAAAMLAKSDQERALTLFETIARGTSSRAPDAAYQWLQMLANAGKWETIEHERDLWLKAIPEKQQATPYFYLGMVAFEKKRHYQAIADLKKSLDREISPPHDRSALEALLSSAKEISDLTLCEASYAKLIERYPERQPAAQLVRATVHKNEGENALALALLEELIQRFPHDPATEHAAVEKVHLLMLEKRWEDAHAAVHEFLALFPKAGRKIEMYRLAVDISQMQAVERDLYAQLVEDLERAFAARVYQEEELTEKRELLAKAYLKLDRVNAALGILHEMEAPDPLLFANCYVKEGNSPEKVIAFGEKAQEKYPENDRLHLHLFNAYLALSKEQNENTALTERAAQHLEAIIDTYPVSLENRLWLAYFFAKQQNERAIALFESFLQTDSNWKRFDKEALVLARLYQQRGNNEKALPILKRLTELSQGTKQEAELLLGEVYLDFGRNEEAEALFSYLEDAPERPIASAATLHLARLRFTRDPERYLKKLHDLQVRKALATEPIHLEAALDRAELEASLFPEKERNDRLLNALLSVKEEFTTTQDIVSKDYHESRKIMPEKDQIYQAYMRYLDARIYLLQAKVTKDPREGKAKEHAARALFSTLRQGKYAVSRYILERASTGMYEG